MRAKPPNLVMVHAAPFGSSYVYHDTVSLDVVLGPDFFLPVRNHFRPGDDLAIRRTENQRVISLVDTIVVSSSREGVVLCIKPGYPMDVPKEDTGYYVTNGGSAGFAVRDANKKIVFTTKDEALANRVAQGDVPIPEAA